MILKEKQQLSLSYNFLNSYICLNLSCSFIFKAVRGTWTGSQGCFLSELQGFNVYFTGTEESFCFMSLL